MLRKLVRVMYGRRDEDITPENDTPTEEEARELVDRYIFKLLQKMSDNF